MNAGFWLFLFVSKKRFGVCLVFIASKIQEKPIDLPASWVCLSAVFLCLFLIQIQGVCYSFLSLSLRHGEGMSVYVQRGRCLAVPQGSGYSPGINAVCNQQRGVEVPKAVNVYPAHTRALKKAVQPVQRSIRVQRVSVPGNKQPIGIDPLIAKL